MEHVQVRFNEDIKDPIVFHTATVLWNGVNL